jgi:hypothetical protein
LRLRARYADSYAIAIGTPLGKGKGLFREVGSSLGLNSILQVQEGAVLQVESKLRTAAVLLFSR